MIKIKLNLALILALALFFPAVSWAAEGAIDLLEESSGPRAIALGGAFTAVSDSISAGWNPAGLAVVQQTIIGSSYTSAFAEISRYGIWGVHPLWGGSLGWTTLLEKTSEAPQTVVGPDGRPEVIGYFSETQWLLALSYGRPIISEKLLLGANLKYHSHQLASASARGWSFDIGTIYHPLATTDSAGPLSLGLMLRNPFNPRINWSTGATDNFAREIVLGVAYSGKISDNPFMITGDFLAGSSKKISAGIEYWLNEFLPIRLGYSKEGSLTVGTGIKFNNISLEVAYFGHSDLGPTCQAGLTWLLK